MRTIAAAALSTFAIVAVVSSCQTYDFERVIPIAVAQTTDKKPIASTRLKPNLMLLLDNSGSMNLPIDKNDPKCPANCGVGSTKCPSDCPTRISQLKSVMNQFLTNSGTVGRLGLSIFPESGADTCRATNQTSVNLPTPTENDEGTDNALRQQAEAINAVIRNLASVGGTPTGGSLEYVGTVSGLNDSNDYRPDYVLLLTDGLPNCNVNNPNQVCACNAANNCSQTQRDSCSCTICALSPDGSCAPGCRDTSAADGACARGCLDQDGAVQAVKNLKMKGIQTIVIGFGAETSAGDGPVVLNAMAKEGGFVRKCPNGTNAECGVGSTCDTSSKTPVCSSPLFLASNGAQLAAALADISKSFDVDPCVHALSDKPSEAAYLSVLIDGQAVLESGDTYTYDYNANEVTFLGSTCTRLEASTEQKPVSVEFRIVQRF